MSHATGPLKDKADQFKKYVAKKIVGDGDCCLVALCMGNICENPALPYDAMLVDKVLGGAPPPKLLVCLETETVAPFQPLPRTDFPKPTNGSRIPVGIPSNLDAVIWCDAGPANFDWRDWRTLHIREQPNARSWLGD